MTACKTPQNHARLALILCFSTILCFPAISYGQTAPAAASDISTDPCDKTEKDKMLNEIKEELNKSNDLRTDSIGKLDPSQNGASPDSLCGSVDFSKQICSEAFGKAFNIFPGFKMPTAQICGFDAMQSLTKKISEACMNMNSAFNNTKSGIDSIGLPTGNTSYQSPYSTASTTPKTGTGSNPTSPTVSTTSTQSNTAPAVIPESKAPKKPGKPNSWW